MSNQANWRDSPNATSSPGSAVGLSLSPSPGFHPTGPYGPAHAPVSLSARQAKVRGLLTSGTYGRPGIGSSNSADLSASLGSRLIARLADTGSTLFLLTWTALDTASGRPYFLLRASAPRKRVTGGTSWPTPTFSGGGDAARMGYTITGHPGETLFDAAALAAWPAPVAGDGNGSRMAKGASTTGVRPDGSKASVSLNQVAQAAHWPAPAASDETYGRKTARTAAKEGMPLRDFIHLLGPATGAARLRASGEMLIGSDAATESGGQLSPDHSRWLMGYPIEWRNCAVTGTRSFLTQRRHSLKRTSIV